MINLNTISFLPWWARPNKKERKKQKKERNEEPIDTQKQERGSSKITSS